jgi:hypothetical protein
MTILTSNYYTSKSFKKKVSRDLKDVQVLYRKNVNHSINFDILLKEVNNRYEHACLINTAGATSSASRDGNGSVIHN